MSIVTLGGKKPFVSNLSGKYVYTPEIPTGCVELWHNISGPYPNSAYLYDISGNGNKGTLSGCTWTTLTSGLIVPTFNGTSDFINFGNPTVLSSLTAMTVCVWVNITTPFTGASRVWFGSGYWNNPGYGCAGTARHDTNNLQINIRNSAGVAVTGDYIPYTAGTWLFASLIWSAGNVRSYKNGVAVGSDQTLAGTITNAGTVMHMGDSAEVAPTRCDCSLGLFRWYNIGLTATDLLAIYTRERGLFGV